VTRNPVLQHIFKTWKITPDVVGTDTEVISGEDCNGLDSEDEDEEVINLSSSIADLKVGAVAETGNVVSCYFYSPVTNVS